MSGDGTTQSQLTEIPEASNSFEDESFTSSLNSSSSLGCKAVFVAVVTVFVALLLGSMPSFLSETTISPIYSVVFDAGSTGSRVSVFCFKPRGSDISGVILESEFFLSVEPGVSAYAQNPQEVVASLQPLLQKALENVPVQHQPTTLVIFKATAGLRLLQKSKADQIIDVVRQMLVSSPLYLPDPNRVEIMTGEEEGIFAWISVNFLLDLIWNSERDDTVAVFDLGGGSIQIAFEVSRMNVLGNILVRDIVRMVLLNAEFNIFTNSYLGYGLKSARLGILGGKEEQNGFVTYDNAVSDKMDTYILLVSSCYSVGTNFTFSHSDVNYIVKGKNPGKNVLPRCQEIIDIFVQSMNIIQNSEMNQQEMHLFSYFFDVARWAKLIPWSERRYVLTPADFYKAAIKYCDSNNFSKKSPFLCIDLLYVHSLLTVGIGLKPDKKLNVETQLLGREVSWNLGAAICSMSDKFSFSPIL